MTKDLLIIKKQKHSNDVKVVIKDNMKNRWSPKKYENIVTTKDSSRLANVLFDLNVMGYPVHEAYKKLKKYEKNPKEWFL